MKHTANLLFETALLPSGWAKNVRVAARDGIIVSVEADAPGAAKIQGVALPGMPNLHSHAFQRGMAGLSERRGAGEDSFWTWREVMYRFLDRLSPDDVEAIAALAQVEMLEAGFTRCAEFHYLHHDHDGQAYGNPAEMAERIAAAVSETGIGLTLLPVFYRYGGFGKVPPGQAQRRFLSTLDAYEKLLEASRRAVNALPGSGLGIAPHSLRAAAPEDLQQLLTMAIPGEPIHIHIAEQLKEVEDCLAWSGQRPVDWLLQNARVNENWCLIHATHMTDVEARGLAASGAVAGLCPVTEANLGDGLFNAAPFLTSGGVLGVGTDSNIRIDMAEELRILEYGQRLANRRRNVLGSGCISTGRFLYEAALAGGALASGAAIGSIAPGMRADIIVIDDESHGQGGDTALDAFVFASHKRAREVWVGGAKVVSGFRHRGGEAVRARFEKTMRGALRN